MRNIEVTVLIETQPLGLIGDLPGLHSRQIGEYLHRAEPSGRQHFVAEDTVAHAFCHEQCFTIRPEHDALWKVQIGSGQTCRALAVHKQDLADAALTGPTGVGEVESPLRIERYILWFGERLAAAIGRSHS